VILTADVELVVVLRRNHRGQPAPPQPGTCLLV